MKQLILLSTVLSAMALCSLNTSATAQTGSVVLEHSVEFTAAELGT